MYHKLVAFVTFIWFFSSPSLAQELKKPISAMAVSTVDFGYLPTLLARSTTGDSQARLLAMESNLAAGSAVNPDVAAHLGLRGYRILMNSAEVYPVPFSGMAVHEDLIRENPDLIKRWLRAHIRAMLYIRKNPEDAAQVAAKELKLTPEVALGATKLLMPLISADDPGGFTENGMRLNLEYSASRQGGDAGKVAITQVADVNPLREVQREMGIRCKDGYQCK